MKNKPTVTKKVTYEMRFGSEVCNFTICKTGDKKYINFEEEQLRFFKEELLKLLEYVN